MDKLKITKAESLEGYFVKLWFSNGEIRVADLAPEYLYEISKPVGESLSAE